MSSFIDKLGYAKESLTDLASDIVNGKEIDASEETVKNRKEICNNCDQQKIIAKLKLCKECGCLIDVKTKGASFHCPINKWLAQS